MIKQRRHPWPIPTDRTALDRARTLARSLLAALAKVDPEAAEQHVQLARQFGEPWLAPIPDTVAGTRLLTTEEAAAIVGRQPVTVRMWSTRGTRVGVLTRHPGGFLEREVVAYAAALAAAAPRIPSPPTPQEAPHVPDPHT